MYIYIYTYIYMYIYIICMCIYIYIYKIADPDKYGYNAYVIRFDARSQFSLPDGSWGRNVIIF